MAYSLLYNVIMLSALIAALALLRDRRTAKGVLSIGGAHALGAVVLAVLMAGRGFTAIRLLAYAIFLHGLLFALGAAVLTWRPARRVSIFVLVCGAALAAIAIDAFLIEPHWIEVTHTTVRSVKLRAPLTVVVLADLQTDSIGPYQQRVFEKIQDLRPDMIVCAGDYVQTRDRESERIVSRQLRQLLGDLPFEAPLGIYIVEGNVDSIYWTESFDGLPVRLFRETESIDLPRDDLRVTGLAMTDSFDRNLQIPSSERFQICVGHAPHFALGQVQADLLVAGHVHGGQVRLPWIGPLMTPRGVPRGWTIGRTRLDSQRTLVVSRGIGMERAGAPRLRFLCRPELMVLHLVPED